MRKNPKKEIELDGGWRVVLQMAIMGGKNDREMVTRGV